MSLIKLGHWWSSAYGQTVQLQLLFCVFLPVCSLGKNVLFAGTTGCQLCLTLLETTCSSPRVKIVVVLLWLSDTVKGRPRDSSAGFFGGSLLTLAPLGGGAEGAAAEGLVSPLLKFIPKSGYLLPSPAEILCSNGELFVVQHLQKLKCWSCLGVLAGSQQWGLAPAAPFRWLGSGLVAAPRCPPWQSPR